MFERAYVVAYHAEYEKAMIEEIASDISIDFNWVGNGYWKHFWAPKFKLLSMKCPFAFGFRNTTINATIYFVQDYSVETISQEDLEQLLYGVDLPQYRTISSNDSDQSVSINTWRKSVCLNTSDRIEILTKKKYQMDTYYAGYLNFGKTECVYSEAGDIRLVVHVSDGVCLVNDNTLSIMRGAKDVDCDSRRVHLMKNSKTYPLKYDEDQNQIYAEDPENGERVEATGIEILRVEQCKK